MRSIGLSGIHSWEEDEGFSKVHMCSHGPLAEAEQRDKAWLEEGDTAYMELKGLIEGKRLAKCLER